MMIIFNKEVLESQEVTSVLTKTMFKGLEP